MALSQNLTQKLTQRLALTQELRHSIELLQLSGLELYERIQQELNENPLLETSGGDSDTEVTAEPYKNESDAKSERSQEQSSSTEEDWWHNDEREFTPTASVSDGNELKQQFIENQPSNPETLAEHLIGQLRLALVEPEILRAGEVIIYAIDENGFLNSEIETICSENGIKPDIFDAALKLIYTLDPVGCGARSVAESLLIQARLKQPLALETINLLENYLPELERLDYDKIVDSTGYSLEMIGQSIKFIRTLKPYPGREYDSGGSSYIVPDLQVVEVDGVLEVIINDDYLPALQINQNYSSLTEKSSGVSDSERSYLEARLNAARWLLKGISHRRATLYRVASEIVKTQEQFFRQGPSRLIPLKLREIAEKTELHESTISRITSNKYIQTRWGIFELKYFFSSGLSGTHGQSEQHSSRTIQERIRKLIENETEENPLSDQNIVDSLKAEGVKIARRTVAKYRIAMQIPSAGDRKKLKSLDIK